jgi:hypothetical protein
MCLVTIDSLIFVQEMQGHFADGAVAYDNLDTTGGDALDDLLHLALLSLIIVNELLGILQ